MLTNTSLLEVAGSISARYKGGLFYWAKKAGQMTELLGLNVTYICESTTIIMGRADIALKEEVAVRAATSGVPAIV